MTTPLEAWALQQLYEIHDDTEARLTEAERALRSSAPTDQMHGRAQVAALWPIHDRLERTTIEFRARMTPEDLAEHLAEAEEETPAPWGPRDIAALLTGFVIAGALAIILAWSK